MLSRIIITISLGVLFFSYACPAQAVTPQTYYAVSITEPSSCSVLQDKITIEFSLLPNDIPEDSYTQAQAMNINTGEVFDIGYWDSYNGIEKLAIDWDTKTMANGEYDIFLTFYYYEDDYDQESISLPVKCTILNGLNSISYQPWVISPNIKGNYDKLEIKYSLNQEMDISLLIKDENGQIITTLKDRIAQNSGNYQIFWDGLDNSGKLAKDGLYKIYLKASDKAGNNFIFEDFFYVSNYPVKIIEPLPNSNIDGKIVSLKCQPAEYVYINKLKAYYRKRGNDQWLFIGEFSESSNSAYKLLWDIATLETGVYEVKLFGEYFIYGEERTQETDPVIYSISVANSVKISEIVNSPNAFSPNSDGYYDSNQLSYIINYPSKVTIGIYTQDEQLIKNIVENKLEDAGLARAVWDGKDSKGQVVIDGCYKYKITACDDKNNKAQGESLVNVDNKILVLILPSQNSLLKDKVKLEFSFFSFVKNGGLYIYLDNHTTQERKYLGYIDNWGNNPLSLDLNTKEYPNGEYSFYVEAYYRDLNDCSRNEIKTFGPYTIENQGVEIIDFKVTPTIITPDGLDPDISNDRADISFNLKEACYTQVKIVDHQDQIIKTLWAGMLWPNSGRDLVKFEWDGTNEDKQLVKNGQYQVEIATVGQAKQEEAKIFVNNKPIFTDFSISPSVFSPDGDGVDDEVSFSFIISQEVNLKVDIYNLEGIWLKTLINGYKAYADKKNTFTWDGRDKNGEFLVPNKYKIVVTADTALASKSELLFYVYINTNSLSNIYTSSEVFNPYNGETVKIHYYLKYPGKLRANMFNDAGILVRTLTTSQQAKGNNYIIWDGKDDTGRILPDSGYYFTLDFLAADEFIKVYDPSGSGGLDISQSIKLLVSEVDSFKNIPAILTFDLAQPAKINVKIRKQRYSGPALRVLAYQEPRIKGQHKLFWDGRDETGMILDQSSYMTAIWAYTLRDNSLIITGGRAEVSNFSVSDNEITNFVSSYHKDNKLKTSISFDLSKQAKVSVIVYDQYNCLVKKVLWQEEHIPERIVVDWDGKDQEGRLVALGWYRVDIQASNDSGQSQIYTVFVEVN